MNEYDPVLYNAEKDIGLRNGDGSLKLKKLTPIHKKMIELHLRGYTIREICEVMSAKYGTIHRILHDPLALQFIQGFNDILDKEFDALRFKANAVVRDCLNPNKHDSVNLRAAELFYKRKGELSGEKDAGKDAMTAEDVASMIIAKIEVNINAGEKECQSRTIDSTPVLPKS